MDASQMMKEIERLKAELEVSEAVEKFMKDCDEIDERIRAHYREGKVIDGKWVNYTEEEYTDEEWDDDEFNECEKCDKIEKK